MFSWNGLIQWSNGALNKQQYFHFTQVCNRMYLIIEIMEQLNPRFTL